MSSVGHLPEGRWEFDGAVTDCFEDMLDRSIPNLYEMRSLVSRIASEAIGLPEGGACECPGCRENKRPSVGRYLGCRRARAGEGATVVDLGTSKGGALRSIRERLPRARLVGVEVSEPMFNAASAAFESDDLVDIRRLDLREDYPEETADVTLAVLALQFIPIEYRLRIVQRAFDKTREGGVLIVVEKVIGGSSEIDRMLVDLYLEGKRWAGYPQGEIDRKRHALEGVLVPVTAGWNEEILRLSGFREVDCFWRWLNFAGWIARKPGGPP